MKNLSKNLVVGLLALFIVSLVFSTINSESNRAKNVSLAEAITQIQNGQIKSVQISGDKLNLTLTNGEKQTSFKESADSFTTVLKNYGVPPEKISALEISVKQPSGASLWLSAILPIALPVLLFIGFFWFMMRQAQNVNNRAMSFGQSLAKENEREKQKVKVTFKDVAGVQEAKQELVEVVDFLKFPKKFTDLGAKIPKGVLLVGAPGTGKTLLAKAVAGEANVPFFHMSGSEFVEMFVGVGASRVRDLFRRAKKAAPSIIFVDEIDAVARQRGTGLGGSHDEREQTLNQILVEMDGFDTETNVIIIAATNRPDVLDPALLRPGRFDRRVILDPPDLKSRVEILKVHSRQKPLGPDVDLNKVAQRTPGFSGADLANLLNEAAILAARRNRKQVNLSDCLESIEKVLLGPERKSHILSDQEKKITAVHEAGHALVAAALPHTDPVHKVSIISRGQAAGYTLKLPETDKHLHPRKEFLDDLAVMLAGQVAEREIFGDITTGAQNDLRQATRLARKLVTDYGMSELGARTFGMKDDLIFLGREITEQRDYSEKIAEAIDAAVDRFLKQAAETAKKVIRKYREALDAIVSALLDHETIEQEEFADLTKKFLPVKVKV
ncbi:ATP-dependent metallopeptidase FtsH/Yme1/Tma family protein [Candidatus Parcubacteria bacterium]|jgi:cell division protease FtsH|nr:MAG: ATP-dependent metallopeptidase FtsH/Yme1/Tma family protein [Candidatus Parcubacteria bacterium]